jgi:hypothetical protein
MARRSPVHPDGIVIDVTDRRTRAIRSGRERGRSYAT